MSINWAMLSPETNPPFTPLPNEQLVHTSPTRVDISIKTPSHYPAQQQQHFELSHKADGGGKAYITNRRILYIPEKPTQRFQSFSAPILKIHDSHVSIPWFGANTWSALVQPTSGGGITCPSGGAVELKLTFNSGGASDFGTYYERVKEKAAQWLETARMNGDGSGSSRAAAENMAVNMEDLPAYSEESDGPLLPPTAVAAAAAQQSSSPVLQQTRDSGIGMEDSRPQPRPTDNAFSPPSEPPPGYEESQLAGLEEEVERRRQDQS
ncbi:hypothetical protein BTJ68_02953 [Lecanosticta acicola]|uniref:WW domain-binding protein n=1 Tax=Lecanosticta acicola TaxID=111012 RepID=A0AAI8Z991_9PEZI|nr:hypothetical protein BTJ68_02953 [Lecanosticta acicola]